MSRFLKYLVPVHDGKTPVVMVMQQGSFLEDCDSGGYPFQICNHNLLLADAIHRGTGRSPILPDACAVVIDETHKLPETARQVQWRNTSKMQIWGCFTVNVGERLNGIQEVSGSIPLISTKQKALEL